VSKIPEKKKTNNAVKEHRGPKRSEKIADDAPHKKKSQAPALSEPGKKMFGLGDSTRTKL